MKADVETILSDTTNDLISISSESSTDKETNQVSNFIRIEAEVPRGFGAFSRCRFTVKVPNASLKVTEEQLDNSDYRVKFSNLVVSYIDTRGTVYFRADDYEVAVDG
jgi:hypothetical protein